MGGNGPHSGARNSSFGLATLRRDGYAAVRTWLLPYLLSPYLPWPQPLTPTLRLIQAVPLSLTPVTLPNSQPNLKS